MCWPVLIILATNRSYVWIYNTPLPALQSEWPSWSKNVDISSLSLILRPTVSRSVCLGVKHPSGAYDQIFITVRQLRVWWCGAMSLTRGRVCRLQLLLALASAVLVTLFYCLRFETSLFVASYDTQGYGGGIRTRLHMGVIYLVNCSPFITLGEPYTEHSIQQYMCLLSQECLC
jgi:hypothetical protein